MDPRGYVTAYDIGGQWVKQIHQISTEINSSRISFDRTSHTAEIEPMTLAGNGNQADERDIFPLFYLLFLSIIIKNGSAKTSAKQNIIASNPQHFG